LALPAANTKNLGVIAMKVTGQEFLVGDGSGKADSLLRYSMSLPVATAVVGMPHPENFPHNVEAARDFSPLNDQRRSVSDNSSGVLVRNWRTGWSGWTDSQPRNVLA
jgi:hypothetical protein